MMRSRTSCHLPSAALTSARIHRQVGYARFYVGELWGGVRELELHHPYVLDHQPHRIHKIVERRFEVFAKFVPLRPLPRKEHPQCVGNRWRFVWLDSTPEKDLFRVDISLLAAQPSALQ